MFGRVEIGWRIGDRWVGDGVQGRNLGGSFRLALVDGGIRWAVRKKIGSVVAFLSTTVATGQMARMERFWFKNGLGGTKLENVANLRGKGASMLAY
jgi:hypothetical protein